MSGGDGLFQANLAAFEHRLPELHARLRAISEPLCTIVYEGGEAVDIDLGSGRLYSGDAREISRQQAEDFIRLPAQAGYNMPDEDAFDSIIARKVHQRLLSMLIDHDLTEMPLRTRGNTGFLFILGCGLGHHLPKVIEGVVTPHVVVCEAFEEFLLASLRVIDWAALFELCESRGGTLDVVCCSSPEAMAAGVAELIDRYGPIYLDGSYYYQHYALWTFAEARRRMINEMPRQMAARGYYEDERKMVRNTVTNFQKGEFGILTEAFRTRSDIPVFVIGAGPSLDEVAPYIKQWRDHAIVVSAGTGLQPCLKMGIIPDFHVELENTYTIYTKLAHILEENADLFPNGRFEGFPLVASSTMNPNVPPLFSEVYYFFRDSASASMAFGLEFGFHAGAAPTVANTSLATIAHMGLGEIYLFGIDCGWRDGHKHHARETIYYTSDELREEHMPAAYTLRGNFGGTVQSNMVFDWSRNLMEAAIAAFHLKAFNCSDGALIKGATPLVAEALEFRGEKLDRTAIMAAVFADAPRFAKGEFFRTRPVSRCQQQLDAYERDLMAVIDAAIAENWPFLKFHDAFWKRFVRESQYHLGIATWVYYATVAMFKQSCVIMNRVSGSEKNAAVLGDFYKIFRQAHEEMFTETREHMTQIAAWLAGGPEPEWTDGLPRVPGTTY